MERINLVELLKDCIGMELDCVIFDDVTLYKIDTSPENEYPIRIETKSGNFLDLTEYGTYSNTEESKCVIFPKGKTSWEGFYRPFKDGDIVTWKDRGSLVAFIYKERKDVAVVKHHFALYTGSLGTETDGEISLVENEIVFATEEEKAKLFKSIRDNGYKWNPDNKTLEKLVEPKFKVGDIIKRKNGNDEYIITSINDCTYYYRLNEHCTGSLGIQLQDDYELVPNKFDINTLVPFESRVLIRDNVKDKWEPAIWGYYDSDKYSTYPYKLIGVISRYCIPYEGNEHLLGTTGDCNEYFKTWEKTGD